MLFFSFWLSFWYHSQCHPHLLPTLNPIPPTPPAHPKPSPTLLYEVNGGSWRSSHTLPHLLYPSLHTPLLYPICRPQPPHTPPPQTSAPTAPYPSSQPPSTPHPSPSHLAPAHPYSPGVHLLSSAVTISSLFIRWSLNSLTESDSGRRHDIPATITFSLHNLQSYTICNQFKEKNNYYFHLGLFI